MIFDAMTLPGTYQILPEWVTDERGSFARVWCAASAAEHGLCSAFVQQSVSRTRERGCLRGMHYQRAPMQEIKTVQCLRGRVYDVLVDLREGSPTCGQWVGVELDGESGMMLYIPEGVAHGYLTLTDDCELAYQMSAPYAPGLAAGVRWDDPAFGIDWPLAPTLMSTRDRTWPDWVRPGG